MDAAQVIARAFPPGEKGWNVSDDFIADNQNIMELPGDVDLLRYVPAYMHWCIRNKDNYDQLVTDYTLNALAEYGRCKDQSNRYLNFKYLCSDDQKKAVQAFYSWSLENLEIVNETQIKRSIKNWS